MTTMWAAFLILSVATTVNFVLCIHMESRMSRRDTPTPTTRPVDQMSELMTMMTTLMKTSQAETRDLVTTLVLGREQPPPTTPQAMMQMPSVRPPDYDDDSIPLAPGIDRVLARESEETEHQRLLRERAAWQQRLTELADEYEKMGSPEDLTDFSPRHLDVERQNENHG